MTNQLPKNITASVHQRLLNKARETVRPFNELLQYFAMERFLYRLSKSLHTEKFVLKGCQVTRIGKITEKSQGIKMLHSNGYIETLTIRGYEHFKS